jgi:hypothetical protein
MIGAECAKRLEAYLAVKMAGQNGRSLGCLVLFETSLVRRRLAVERGRDGFV